MFTGIVEEVGTVVSLARERPHDRAQDGHEDGRARLEIACTAVLEDAHPGASIAVNGCCLTVHTITAGGNPGFVADLMAETLRVTNLGRLTVGASVNLERPLAANGRFGGHVVQGHVDAVAEVVDRDERPGTVFLTISRPTSLAHYLVPKGSVAVDGVSLTVVDVDDAGGTFRIGLIPHTCAVTTLGDTDVGDHVNLEVDILAKYVERAIARDPDTSRA